VPTGYAALIDRPNPTLTDELVFALKWEGAKIAAME